MIHVYRVELRKLFAQVAIRALFAGAVAVPLGFAVVLRVASITPGDTLFGIWVSSTGYAGSLVLLSWGGTIGFPVIAGVVAGDIFSGEDRHNTWKAALTRGVTRAELFAGKALASAVVCSLLLLICAAASLAGCLLLEGASPLVGVSGQQIGSGAALLATLLAWISSLPPLLAFAALALMLSAVTRNGIVGVVVPVLLSFVMTALELFGNGIWVHQLLVQSAFDDWHGLFASPRFLGQLALGTAVSLGWIAICLAVTRRSLARRDFAGPAHGAAPWRTVAAWALGGVAALALIAAGVGIGPTAITPRHLQGDVRATFNRLTLYQQQLLGRRIPAGAKVKDTATCARRGADRNGPGGDWVCTVLVLLPQAATPNPSFEPVDYDLSVKVNGCWSGEGPPSFIGNQTFHSAHRGTVVNPLFRIDGCFNPL